MGIRTDTNLVGQDYSNLSMLFYIGKLLLLGRFLMLTSVPLKGFLLSESPQYLAQYVSHLALYLGINIMLWGIVLACHAACTSYAGLAICRTLLSVYESCVAPILVLIITMRYKKEEQGRHVSWFYV